MEIDGQLRKVLMVVKMRGGDHSKDIVEYDITPKGLRLGERMTGYHGLITGVPQLFISKVKDGESVSGTANRKE